VTKPKSIFKADIEKYYSIRPGFAGLTLGGRIGLWTTNFGLHCVVCYRFGKYAAHLYARNKLLGIIPVCAHRLLSYFVHMVHHVDIDAATIGPGLYIGHVGTIYIGRTVIGRNFSLSHNVTIGIGHSEAGEGIPTIGDDVWVGTGSIISGAITIGNRVTVANGCILSRSVPDGCLVAGNPGRVVLRDYDNSKLLGWKIDDDAAV
jgi:serine O-acetyltransferase